MSPLTDAQRAIVTDLDSSLCVTSGAGCGKTSVLVARYIEFLEKDLKLPLQHLAAITFTENAAAEMRDRIRQACRRQVADDPAHAAVWLDRYRDVDIAPIDTIHAFCAALLRRYAIEAGIDPNFALLDETEAAFLREDVVRATIEQLLDRDDADLLTVLAHYNLDPARELLTDVLQEKRELLQRVAAPVLARSDEEILRDLKRRVDEEILRALREALDSPDVRDALDLLARGGGQEADKLERARREALAQAERLRGARTAEIAMTAAEAIVSAIDLRGGSKKLWPSAEALTAAKTALGVVRDTLKELLKDLTPFDEATDRRHLALARAFYNTSWRVIEAYEAAKRERSALDFEDLQSRARDLLRKDERVREECRRRYRAILVDELQDTNLLQFEIVDLLVSEAPAGRKAPRLRQGAFFGVGDPKQSIYRFRGAEFEVFQRALARVGPDGRRGLDESFRLHDGTASLVNHLFAPLMGDLYEPITGKHEQKNAAVAELLYAYDPSGERFHAEDGLAAEAARLAMRLREIIETKAVTVWDAGAKAWRPARYGDVAILMRRMSYLHIYEKALEDHEVPYYVVAGRGFFKQQEVLDVIHLLRVLNDPTDDLHLAGVLRSPFFAVSDEGLFRLKQTGRPLHAALAAAAEADRLDPEDRRGLRRAASLLPRWTAAKDRLGLAALVDHVALESGYGASAVGRFGGERAYANLRQMVELARRFERQGLYALGDFIGYVTDFMRSEMRQEQAPVEVPGGNTVRLMTIHKAKGLEFPVVVVPDLAYVPKGGQGQFFVHPATGVALRMRDEEGESRTSSALALARRDAADADRAETWRLFYVALTRAKDYLLFASHVGYTSDAGTWLDALRQGLKYDGRPGEMGLELPSRHIIHVNAGPPGAKAGGKAERRVGSRGLFEAGRVAWGQLHERGQRAKKQGALSALEQVRPVASPRQAPVRITATAIETYRHCPALYWWSEVLGVREPEPPVLSEIGLSAMAWGVLGHRALELATSPDDAVVRAAVESSFRETPVASRTSEGRLRERLTAAIRGFWESPIGKRAAGARRVFREMPFVLALDGTEIRGKMDLLFEGADGRWEVVDYKSSVVAAEAAAERAEEYELQLGVYALAASRWLGQPVSRRSVFFLGSGVGASRDLGLADVGRIEEAARRALAGIAAGQYERETIERCRACRHKRLCETGVKS